MASWEKLLLQIVTKLRTDTGTGSLVALTGHTSSDARIARSTPPTPAKSPFLGVVIEMSIPLIGEDVTQLQVARVCFEAYGKELDSMRIADRVEHLLHTASPDTNLSYYDFSGDDVSNRMTRFQSRSKAVFDEENDVWCSKVIAALIWVNVPCE